MEDTEENEKKRSEEETCEGSERTGDKDKRKEMEGKGWVAWPKQLSGTKEGQKGREKKERRDPKPPPLIYFALRKGR